MRLATMAFIVILFLSGISYADTESAFVLLNTANMDQVHEVVSLIEAGGGRVRIVFPPSALIADGVSAAVERSHLVESVHRSSFDASPLLARGDQTTYYAARAWLDMTSQRERPRSPVEPLKVPLDDLRLRSDGHRDSPWCDQPGAGTAPNAGFCDGTEYMAGTVAVDVIMPESDGSIDPSTEDWTPEEEAIVVLKITEGLDWWVARAVERNVPLTFFLRFHYRVPTGYEPINNNSVTGSTCGLGDEYLWKNECLDHLGVTEDCLEGEFVLLNATRDSLETDWAFQAWIVDATSDEDHRFLDGFFAYAYLGGPSLTYAVYPGPYGDWSYLGTYVAHETGHIFWAFDQYLGAYGCDAEGDCEKRTGYLNVENQNCGRPECLSDEYSIMRCSWLAYTNGLVDPYAAGQVGWLDTDEDGIQDVLDLQPIAALYSHVPDPTDEVVISYAGSTHVAPGYTNSNRYHIDWPQSYGPAHDINVNKIQSVEWCVDGSPWAAAVPSDGGFNDAIELYWFEDGDVTLGIHVYEARATNTSGNESVPAASDTLTVVDWVSVPDVTLPVSVGLSMGRPNPFREDVELSYSLPSTGSARLAVYDVAGRLVRVILDSEVKAAGPHLAFWDGTDDHGCRVASGVYTLRLEACGQESMRRIVLVK